MSYWSEKALADQEEYEWARGILCEIGALEECENHPGTFFDGGNDVEGAYKLVNKRVTSGEIKLDKGQSRTDLTDLIKAVYDDNSGLTGCPECEENFGPG